MPEAFCSHCGALRTSRTPVCASCGGEFDPGSPAVESTSGQGLIARQPRHLLIALLAALVTVLGILVFVILG